MFKRLFRYILVAIVGAGVLYLGGTNYIKFSRDIDLKHPFQVFNIDPVVEGPEIDVDTPNIDNPTIDVENPNIDISVDKPTMMATKILLEKPDVKLNTSGNAALLHWRKGITEEEFNQTILRIRISDVETTAKYNRELFENPSKKYEYNNVKLSRNKYAWNISKWLIRNDENDFAYKDPYTGIIIRDESKLDYEHLIALKYAWEHGAYKWTEAQMNTFSYDITGGLDVSASANRSKGSKGPSDWLPIENPEDYCWSYFNIAARYDISMTRNDFNVCKLQILNCFSTKGCTVEELNKTVFDE